LKNDLPKNSWSIKTDVSREIVTLRNYLWPGYLSYVWIDENRYGYSYFGDGVKNVEMSLYV
jgi:Trm5-related predicted tRNA methylase